jgi:hypothetical protein
MADQSQHLTEISATYRLQAQALRLKTVSEVLKVWPALNFANIGGTFPRWLDLMFAVVSGNRAIASGLAGQFVTDIRKVSDVPGPAPRIVVAKPVDPVQLYKSMSSSSIGVYFKGSTAGLLPAPAASNALVQVSGAASRLASNGGRETVIGTVATDAKALGWERVSSSSPCGFCALLVSRGPVYRGDSTASFKSHDHCGCTAHPVYGNPRLTEQAAAFKAMYRNSQPADGQSALNAFRSTLGKVATTGEAPTGE